MAAAVLAWLGVKAASPENFRTRRWLAWGLTANALGQILWNSQILLGAPPVPNIADAAFLTVGFVLSPVSFMRFASGEESF